MPRIPRIRSLATLLTVLSASVAPLHAAPAADEHRVVRALEAASPIVVDGVLDEAVWRTAVPAADFVQSEPDEGAPATETTEIRIAFDKDALYVGILCHDREAGAIRVNEIRKDFVTPGEQDTVSVLLDTFGDRRNAFVFTTNAAGARADTQIANEGRDVNTNWDAVWNVQARHLADGWSAEMRIPFKTLRFEEGSGRTWGINFQRRLRRRNETDYWSPIPRMQNLYRVSLAGNLDGLPDLEQGRNLRVKPFIAASSTRPTGGTSSDADLDVGLDVKYGITPALTLDLTARPDFAQAEADEQQVNLTQFSLFYPEKREFFLENSGIFYFGDIARESRTQPVRFAAPEEELLLFFSRRIGLTDAGEQIPILGGARVTGRAAGLGVGAMTIQTGRGGGREGDNYSVVRVRRDVLGKSDIGAIVLSRQSAGTSGDFNRVAGVDANFRFRRELSINTFVARSATAGQGGDDYSWKASATWTGGFQHWQYSLLSVGDEFQDDIGFIKRRGVRKHFFDGGIRPRPASLKKLKIREVHPHTRINEYTDQHNRLVTRQDHAGLTLMFEGGGFFELVWNPRAERIDVPFKVHTGSVFTPGKYTWNEYEIVGITDQSREIALTYRLTWGGFWNGTQNAERLAVVLRPNYRSLVDIGWQRNDITLAAPLASFTTNLVSSRLGYAFSTRMFLDALLQYNTDSKQFNANLRFNLIHRPLSDLFVVYNQQDYTDRETPAGRGLIVKYTHMLAF